MRVILYKIILIFIINILIKLNRFNNLLMTHKFGDKLKILSNYTFYKEMNDIK